MKINFTLFGAGLTGGNFNLIEVAQRLAKRGHEIIVTSIGSPRDLNWFKNKNFQINFAPLTNKFLYKVYRKLLKPSVLHPFPATEIKELIKIMPDCDINIATSHFTTPAVHRSAKGQGFYYIQHFDSWLIKDRLANNIHNESYYLPLEKITVSSWLKDIINEKLKTNIKYVITAGVDKDFFYPRPKNNKKLRIISLGRRVEWKGFGELEQAMRELFKERADFEWIVFSSHDTPRLKLDAPFTLVKSPYGEQLGALYASCDIAVNPSYHEGFAQPALEAMASGCAVITTEIGAEDFARPDNSLIIRAKDYLPIKQSILKLLDNPDWRKQLSQQGCETAKNFYWDRIIDKWENLFKKYV